MPDAVVVGSGPNGLAAAITLARAGRSVLVVEAAETIGGGVRSAELTLPGFVHDVCSAIHPLAKASPFFRELPLDEHGLELVDPPAPLAHPLDDGTAVMLERSVEETAAGLGPDADAYRKLMAPLVERGGQLEPFLLGRSPIPRHPLAAARFGLLGLRSAVGLADRFEGERARALFAGLAAHSIQDLYRPPTASFGLVLGTVRRTRTAGRSSAVDRSSSPTRSPPTSARSAARSRPAGVSSPSTSCRESAADDARRHAPTAPPRCRSPPAGPLLAGAAPLPLRAGRLQGRLGARRARAVAGRGLRAGGDDPPRRDARGDRGLGASRLAGRGAGAPVRARRPAEPLRRDARAGRKAHALGVLPRPERVHGGHDRADRGAGRALRARVPRPRPGAQRARPGRDRARQRELRRRRHQRRRPGPPAALHAARDPAEPVLDAGRRALHLLVVDAAGRRRPRPVRLLRGAVGAQSRAR